MLKYISRFGSTLFAQLPIELANELRAPIQDALALGNTTAVNLQKDIYSHGNSSKAFLVLQDFLTNLFGTYSQTTIVNNVIYIGNGLQLSNNPTTKALFLALDPNRDWDFANLFSKPGYPVPALTSDEISKLTWLSMIGINNPQYGNFTGYLPSLIEQLGVLSQNECTTNQLFGLLTTTYSTNLPLPSTIQDALNFQLDYEPLKEIAPMMCIVEYANPAYDPFLANLCLASGAMYLGEPEQKYLGVHTTHRTAGRIIEASNNTIIVDGTVKWGFPYGEDQDSFIGMDKVTEIPSFNPILKVNDANVLGTPNADIIEFTQSSDSSAVVYAGNGDDQISFISDVTSLSKTNSTSFFFAVGGQGNDIYSIGANSAFPDKFIHSNTYIMDIDHAGQVRQNISLGHGRTTYSRFAGPIVDEQFVYYGVPYNITRIQEIDGNLTLRLKTDGFSELQQIPSVLTIGNYIPDQFDLWSNNKKIKIQYAVQPAQYPASQFSIAITPQGYTAIYYQASNTPLSIYDVNGLFVKQLSVPEVYIGLTSLGGFSDENFYAIGEIPPSYNHYCTIDLLIFNPKTGNVNVTSVDQFTQCDTPYQLSAKIIEGNEGLPLLVYTKPTSDNTVLNVKAYAIGDSPKVITSFNFPDDIFFGASSYNSKSFMLIFNYIWLGESVTYLQQVDVLDYKLLANTTAPGSGSFVYNADDSIVAEYLYGDMGIDVTNISLYSNGNWSSPFSFVPAGSSGMEFVNVVQYGKNIMYMPVQQNNIQNSIDPSYVITTENELVAGPFYLEPARPAEFSEMTVLASRYLSTGQTIIVYAYPRPNSESFDLYSLKMEAPTNISQVHLDNVFSASHSENKLPKEHLSTLRTLKKVREKRQLDFEAVSPKIDYQSLEKSDANVITADIFDVNEIDRVSRWTSDATQSVVGFFSRTISSATSKATEVLQSTREYVLPDHLEKELTGEQLEKLQLYIDDVARLRKSASYLDLQGYEYYAAELDELSAQAEKYLDTKCASMAELKNLTYQSSYWTRQYVQPCESRLHQDPFDIRWQQWNLAHPSFAINATEVSVAKIQTTLFGASVNSSMVRETILPMISAGAAMRYLGR